MQINYHINIQSSHFLQLRIFPKKNSSFDFSQQSGSSLFIQAGLSDIIIARIWNPAEINTRQTSLFPVRDACKWFIGRDMRLGVVVWIIAYSCVSRWNFLIEAESLRHTAKQNKLSAIFTLLAFSAQFIPDTLSLFTSPRLIVTWTSQVKTKFRAGGGGGRGEGEGGNLIFLACHIRTVVEKSV